MTVYTPSDTPLPAALTPAPRRKPRPRPERKLSVRGRLAGGVLLVEIAHHYPRSVKRELYRVRRVCADYGQGFLWEGLGEKEESRYHCNLADDGGGEESPVCECKGFEAGRECKHIAAVKRLLELGSL